MTQDPAVLARRLPTLDGMRGIAAIVVFISHSTLMNFFADERVDDRFFGIFSRTGSAALNFFFILSGFVLAWSAVDGDTKQAFWRRRAAKIVPNNLLICAACVVLLLLTGQGVSLWPALANFALVQTWFPNMDIFNGLNPPTWSLSCEVFFYVAFPWLIAGIRRIPSGRLWLVAGGLVAGMLALPFIAMALPAEPAYTYANTSFPRFWLVYGLPLSRILDFTLGIILARLVREDRIRVNLPTATLLTLAFYGVSQVVPLLFSVVVAMVIPAALLVVAGARVDIAGKPSPLRARVPVWLGDSSYAFYLIHIIVLYFASQLSPDGWGVPGAIGVMVGSYLVTLGLGGLLYTYYERPMMRRFGRSRPVAVDPPRVALPQSR
ncbi:acyltransferase [Plantactinospora sp. S1510]|uniref:Acyltransferase n=1 Tax=Plantactinospora alkalitolerans TaxID=2789879 RepID=A0ABS0H9N2_9ACTN|nr:acyltransferase [Plantactinospora alkalitolerans]MBF9134859.1 acyltransferase [Plantactinospora alkalitolerans]